MSKCLYAKRRIAESILFISKEMKEFEEDYLNKTWQDYKDDTKLQKLMDRTVENILTALIEASGSSLAEEGIAAESYSDVLKKAAQLFDFDEDDQESLAKLALQRNRLAHRYLNFRWDVITMYTDKRHLIKKLLTVLLKREESKEG
ncbi:MAG: HepT-like ribonuclease domain-containing protein [Thermodesulfobacteriota bacterium]|nr:HepT-like ribonuclease domain-containing protein [Thermodesulfobacteriota bacterium]